jgi:hypothetical protein
MDENIKKLIELKNKSTPYFSGGTSVITDVDSFPYQRFYRGKYNSPNPVIMDREAGWRPRCDDDYRVVPETIEVSYPNHCFQSATTTVYPCRPEYQRKYSDKKEMDLQLFLSKTNQYR